MSNLCKDCNFWLSPPPGWCSGDASDEYADYGECGAGAMRAYTYGGPVEGGILTLPDFGCILWEGANGD